MFLVNRTYPQVVRFFIEFMERGHRMKKTGSQLLLPVGNGPISVPVSQRESLFRSSAATATRPLPNSAKLPGSGVPTGGPTIVAPSTFNSSLESAFNPNGSKVCSPSLAALRVILDPSVAVMVNTPMHPAL